MTEPVETIEFIWSVHLTANPDLTDSHRLAHGSRGTFGSASAEVMIALSRANAEPASEGFILWGHVAGGTVVPAPPGPDTTSDGTTWLEDPRLPESIFVLRDGEIEEERLYQR